MATEVMRLGRNDLCRCGSGRKYKKCCLSAVQARMTPPRPAQRNGERLVFHQTPAEVAAAREQGFIPPPRPQLARPSGPSSVGGETIEATGGHPFWVISGEDLDKRPVPQHCPAEVPNSAIPGRWVNAIDLRVGDVLFTRDGRRVPVTHVSVRQVKTTVYNLSVAELENYAVGHMGILVHNTSGTPSWRFGSNHSPTQWQNKMAQRGWTPEQITEAVQGGQKFPATNNIAPANGATRHVHPTTGRSVVVDNATGEVIHIGGDGFVY